MFLHGGWGHLLGNMLFFWVFGNNIEDSMGPGRFLVFYLICGLVAAGAHVLVEPASPVPTVGASGAISGVLGAYLVLYPKVRVNMLFIFIIFFKVFAIPAWLVLIWWFFAAGAHRAAAALADAAGRLGRRRGLGAHRRIPRRRRADQAVREPRGSSRSATRFARSSIRSRP